MVPLSKRLMSLPNSRRTELSSIDDNKDLEKKLQKDRRAIEHELLDAAYKLTAKRTEAAGCLLSEIVAELFDLEMNGARFEVSFTRHEKSKFFCPPVLTMSLSDSAPIPDRS